MRLSISLATRGRPKMLVENIKKSVALWTRPDTTLWIMADEDDRETVYAASHEISTWNKDGRRIFYSVKPREDTVAAKWNRILKLDPDADVYMVDADDAPFITPGYDAKVLEAAARFNDGIGFVYGHMANASFPCIQCFTNKAAKKLGFIYPEYFPYWFSDHWIDDIARITGRISFADIRTDQGEPPKTMEMRETAWWGTWFDAAYQLRLRQAHSLINDPEFISDQKDVLLTHHPLILYRSRWVNDQVRANSKVYDDWSGLNNNDERYQRLKKRALGMVPELLDGMPALEAKAFRNLLTPPTVIPNLMRRYA